MKTLLHSGASRLLTLIYALALSGILPACTDDADRELPDAGKGGTVTLELSLSVPPMLETKAVICEADSGSEARKAGFYYEMQVQTTDTTGNNGGHVVTKAASSLKNIYAFLFKNNGTFNGRASLAGEVDITESLLLKFEGVTSTTESNGRLVIIANDAAGANYKSDPAFDTFDQNYSKFQEVILTSGITKDEDIPYVGSTTVSLDDGNFTLSDAVPLYRMLAKIVLYNETFNIKDGPARDSINLHNAGNKYFGTPNGYDGAGDTQTTAARYSTTATVGKNENTNTWYVGENVQTNDSTKAAYIELGTEVLDKSNTTPKVGEEYIIDRVAFKYKVYLKNYALRRNNVYTVRVNVSGDLAFHRTLASTEGSNVSEESTVVHGGLNIGMYGGAEGYTPGEDDVTTISGTYTKYLLLQPNTSGTTDKDTERRLWSINNGITYQTETLKFWDPTYTLADKRIDKTSGYAYDYCNKLTIGNVPAGTWYLPTQMQLAAIYGIWRGIKKNSFYANYSTFDAFFYWSATENSATDAWEVYFNKGEVLNNPKDNGFSVRCVRDLPLPILSAQTVTIDSGDHPVIDLSALQPLGAVLSFAEASERRTEMKDATPSNASYLPGQAAVSGENGTWNAQMSGKFQVMCADHTVGPTDWATAYNACKSYIGEDSRAAGEWRLPTQRELTQIMILHPQLIGKGDFQALTAKAYYWTLTESVATGAWYLYTTNWKMSYGNSNKTKGYSVRCIRDVE